MGNDAICKTTRIGSINLKMFDRKARLNKYETHFGVKKNLISLGVLGVAGSKFSRDGITDKVTKGYKCHQRL